MYRHCAFKSNVLPRYEFPKFSAGVLMLNSAHPVKTNPFFRQALLVFGVLEFEQEIHPVLIANAVIGIWLITNGMMARVGSNLPQGLAWLSVVAGIGLILIIVGFWVGGQESLLTIVGGILSFIGILIWAIWLG